MVFRHFMAPDKFLDDVGGKLDDVEEDALGVADLARGWEPGRDVLRKCLNRLQRDDRAVIVPPENKWIEQASFSCASGGEAFFFSQVVGSQPRSRPSLRPQPRGSSRTRPHEPTLSVA